MPSRTTASLPPSRPAACARAPAVRAQALEASPARAGIPGGLPGRLDAPAAAGLNARVGMGWVPAEIVAAGLPKWHGMI
ncbi:MAG TPA: hypothetical protein VMM59_05040 [Thermohalobaculum sp.]|nr:hypothetical protein [Thermohalobaculum sp.]